MFFLSYVGHIMLSSFIIPPFSAPYCLQFVYCFSLFYNDDGIQYECCSLSSRMLSVFLVLKRKFQLTEFVRRLDNMNCCVEILICCSGDYFNCDIASYAKMPLYYHFNLFFYYTNCVNVVCSSVILYTQVIYTVGRDPQYQQTIVADTSPLVSAPVIVCFYFWDLTTKKF